MNTYHSVVAYAGTSHGLTSLLSWTGMVGASQGTVPGVLASEALRGQAFDEALAGARLSPTTAWLDSRVDTLAALVSASRFNDLLVLSQPDKDDPASLSQKQAAMLVAAASCPLLFVPPAARAREPARVLVGWSDTRESARALHDALPLLQRAQSVQVCEFAPHDAPVSSLDELEAYLNAHSVKARCAIERLREISFDQRMLTPTVVDASLAELLLSHAADMDADLIVMGGYGHARLHEWVLGGVTRTMLASMTVPVLMSH